MMETKKGENVIVKGFTGIKLGVFTVESTTKKTITVMKKNGDEMIFDRKTGKQINVAEGKERYANSIMEDDGSFVAPSRIGAKRKKAKKAKKAEQEEVVESEETEEVDEDEEDEPEEKPVKKAKKAKKTSKKTKKVEPEEEPEEDFDEDDEDDDEFEEVDD